MAKDKVLRCVMGRNRSPSVVAGYKFMPRSHARSFVYGCWRAENRRGDNSSTFACAALVHRALDKPIPQGRAALVEVRIRRVKLLKK